MPTIDLLQSNNVVSATSYDRVKRSSVTVNPFQVNKTWNTYSASNAIDINLLYGIYTDTIPSIGSNIAFPNDINEDGSYQVSIYHSVNHLFYKRKNQPFNCFGQNDITRTKKFLFQSASIFSIPQDIIGEGIKPESVEIALYITGSTPSIYGVGIFGVSSYGATPYQQLTNLIKSDRYGNLYDSVYDTGSIIPNVKYYEGFNEYFDTDRIPYTSVDVTYVDGITTTTGLQKSLGLCAYFNGNGYIQTEIEGNYNRDNDYAISLFISASNSDSGSKLIIAKANNTGSTAYPFKIELSGSNQIVATVQGATNYYTQITSSGAISNWTHVLCQKTGSVWQLYIDGTLNSEVTSSLLDSEPNTLYTASAYIHNNEYLKIGGYDANTSNLQGYIDEVRIYNHALTTSSISALNDRTEAGMGCIQTNHVGNIFEKQGLAVISTINYLYHDTIYDWAITHQSTITMYELNVLVQTNKGSFNITQNPTALKDDNQTIKTALTGSDFKPYITTIGLYNDRNELVAIGKLAQPIQKRDDIDVNFLVRIDLDMNIPGYL